MVQKRQSPHYWHVGTRLVLVGDLLHEETKTNERHEKNLANGHIIGMRNENKHNPTFDDLQVASPAQRVKLNHPSTQGRFPKWPNMQDRSQKCSTYCYRLATRQVHKGKQMRTAATKPTSGNQSLQYSQLKCYSFHTPK